MKHSHTVQQGEDLLSIAIRFGYASVDSLYNHPDNKALREKRSDPMCLKPGDTVMLPEKETVATQCKTGCRHHFVVTRPKAYFTMSLRDINGNPLKGVDYTLIVGNGDSSRIKGKSNDKGEISEPISVTATQAELVVHMDPRDPQCDIARNVIIGGKNPVETVSGRQARLNNLGYFCGSVDNNEGEYTRSALLQYQTDHLPGQHSGELILQKLQDMQNPAHTSPLRSQGPSGVSYRGKVR